ncbi:MAG: Flp pilus assembly protein TadG [Candidatus Poriferisodalaceae bacterium]|jgi:hypothetical protein
MSRRPASADGQATVEFALVLPLVLLVLLSIVQVGLVGRDRVLNVHAARAGARAAAVDAGPAAVREAVIVASGLDPGRVTVQQSSSGSTVTVTVSYRSATDVPLVGAMVGDVLMDASVTMRRER